MEFQSWGRVMGEDQLTYLSYYSFPYCQPAWDATLGPWRSNVKGYAHRDLRAIRTKFCGPLASSVPLTHIGHP